MRRPDRRCVNRSIRSIRSIVIKIIITVCCSFKSPHKGIKSFCERFHTVCAVFHLLSSSLQFHFVAVLLAVVVVVAAFDFKRIWKLCFLVSVRFVIVIIIDLSKLSNCLLCNWVSDSAFYALRGGLLAHMLTHTHRLHMYGTGCTYVCVLFGNTFSHDSCRQRAQYLALYLGLVPVS